MNGYAPNDPKGWDDIPDVEVCPECHGEGSIWKHFHDPQDDIEVPCPLCTPKAGT